MVTPQIEYPELAKALNRLDGDDIGIDIAHSGYGSIERIFLKREDMHPYGSHKGRSIPVMIDIKAAGTEGTADKPGTDGAKVFALSSSGNAALAAIRHIRHRNAHGDNLSLKIFVGKNINPEKKQRLLSEIKNANNPNITIIESPRPLQSLFSLVKNGLNNIGAGLGISEKVVSLRQSTDPDALIGYQTLANEIALIPELSAVFIPTSSGTTAQAIAESFINNKVGASVHVVQSTDVSPIASSFNTPTNTAETNIGSIDSDPENSLADAIIDKVAHRKNILVDVIKKTIGTGWVATNDDIRLAQKLIKENTGIDVTANGALGLAGVIKALRYGEKFKGSVVCVVTGR